MSITLESQLDTYETYFYRLHLRFCQIPRRFTNAHRREALMQWTMAVFIIQFCIKLVSKKKKSKSNDAVTVIFRKHFFVMFLMQLISLGMCKSLFLSD